MRPFSATRHKYAWAAALAAFIGASMMGFLRGHLEEAVLTGVLVTAFLAALSLKRIYKSKVGALGALVTLGITAGAYLAGLAAISTGDWVLAASAGGAVFVIAAVTLLDVVDIRRETARLSDEGKRRRINPVLLAASLLCVAAGAVMLFMGMLFGGVWLVALGVLRGILEVGV